MPASLRLFVSSKPPAVRIEYGWLSKHMPLRQEAQFLGERARRVREIAEMDQTPLSNRLREITGELEERADELERANPPPINRRDRRAGQNPVEAKL
jgi:hypothetical protein